MATQTAPLNPFTAQDLALAREIVTQSDRVLALLQSCQNCQVDVAAYTAQVNSYRDFANGILQHFAIGDQSV